MSNSLIDIVAKNFNIEAKREENGNEFKFRVLFSLIGQYFYSLTFTQSDDIESFKPHNINYIKHNLNLYIKTLNLIYPEVFQDIDVTTICEDLLGLYTDLGYIYKTKGCYFASPFKKYTEEDAGISFIRGYGPKDKIYLSGLGPFIDYNLTDFQKVELSDFFDIDQCKEKHSVKIIYKEEVNTVKAQWHVLRKTQIFSDFMNIFLFFSWPQNISNIRNIKDVRTFNSKVFYIIKKYFETLEFCSFTQEK